MGGSHLLSLYSATQASRLPSLHSHKSTFLSKEKQAGKSGHEIEERAPSTAQEFERVAEEKSRQGFPAQSVEKAQDAVVEVAGGESTSESVKEDYKEDLATGDFHKTGKDKQ